MADITIDQVRQQYPQYKDLSDDQLAQGLHQKFYSDMPYEQFTQKIGLQKPPPVVSPPAHPEMDAAKAGLHLDPVGAGISDLLTHAVASIPHGIMHGVADTASRALGQGDVPDSSVPLNHTLGQSGQNLLHRIMGLFPGTPNGLDVSDQEIRDNLDPTGKQPIEALRAQYAKEGNKPLPELLAGTPIGDVLGGALHEAGDVAEAAPGVAVAGGAARLARAGIQSLAPEMTAGGLTTRGQGGLRTAVAGESGTKAQIIANQSIADRIAANDIAHPTNAPMTPDSLVEARAPANAVYNRAAASLPTAPIDAQAMGEINAADQGGRITRGTPASREAIGALQAQLGEGAVTGDQIIRELTGLRQDGFANAASIDVDKRTLGRAQLNMANALEGHIERNLPANAPVSADQLRAARTLLAKNSTVAAATTGGSIDTSALARIHEDNPAILTGGLRHLAEHAANNTPVAATATQFADANLPTYLNDLKSVNPLTKLGSFIGMAGTGTAGPSVARRMLTGSAEARAAQADAAFPPRGTADLTQLASNEFNPPAPPAPPQRLLPAPTPPTYVNAGGGATTAGTLGDELGMTPDIQAAGPRHPAAARPGVEVPAPEPRDMPIVHDPGHQKWGDFSLQSENAPRANAGGRREDAPLADLLAGGVEHGAPPELTAGPMGAPAHTGIPYTLDPSFMSRGLSLGDQLAPGAGASLNDVPKVMSQGVPEDIMTRTNKKPKLKITDIVKGEPGNFQVQRGPGKSNKLPNKGA